MRAFEELLTDPQNRAGRKNPSILRCSGPNDDVDDAESSDKATFVKCIHSAISTLEAQAPPAVMLNDGNLLIDKNLQKTFNEIMDKNSVGKLTSNLSLWAKALRDAVPQGLALAKVPTLGNVRQFGKKCCGAHAVLLELQAERLPKEVDMLENHVIQIESRLRKKGIGEGSGMVSLPPAFAKVLEATKAAGQKAKAAKAAKEASELKEGRT